MRKLLLIPLVSLICFIPLQAMIDAVSLYEKWKSDDSPRLMKMGEKFDYANAPDSALVCYSIVADRLAATDRRTDAEKRLYARALNNLGFVYASWYFDYIRALSLFLNSAEVSEEAGYAANLAYTWLNMGGVYLSCNQIFGRKLFQEEIWDCSEKGLDASLASRQWEAALACMTNVCIIFRDDPQSERFARMAAKVRAASMPSDVRMSRFYLALIAGTEAYSRGDREKALEVYSTLPSLVEKGEMLEPRYRVIAHAAIAGVLEELGRLEEASAHTHALLDVASAANLSDDMAKAYHTLSEQYGRLGDAGRQKEYLFRYYAKKDSIITEREVAGIRSLPLTNQVGTMTAEICREREKKHRVVIISSVVAGFSLLLLVLIVYLVRSRRRLRSYSREIYLRNVELLQSERREREQRRALEAERERDRAASTGASDASEEKVKYRNSALSEEEGREIVARIEDTMQDTALICDPHFSLQQLSDAVGYSYKAVSQAINDRLGKNFKTLLSEYRVKEACLRLLDQNNYGNYTIEHIAQSVGFQSRSNFSVTFKSIVGISPSEFQRNARSDGSASVRQ